MNKKYYEHLSRDNHFIPKMYLNQWATDKQVYQHELLVPHEDVPNWRKRSISGIGYLKNLYIRDDGGTETDDIEEFFAQRFETPAAKPLQKIQNGEKLSKEDWNVIIDFAIAQYVRTPAFFIELRDKSQKSIPGIIDDITEPFVNAKLIDVSQQNRSTIDTNLLPLSLTVTNEKPDDNHSLVKIETVIGKSFWIMMIKHFLEEGSDVRNAMHSIHWSIAENKTDFYWPTTDNPLVFAKRRQTRELLNRISEEDTVLLFPLSPTKVLISSNPQKFPLYSKVSPREAQVIKRLIVNNALQYIYSKTEDSEVCLMKQRTVDNNKYLQYINASKTWHDSYKKMEVPLLNSRKIIFEDV